MITGCHCRKGLMKMKMKWISVKDRVPGVEEVVLMFIQDETFHRKYISIGERFEAVYFGEGGLWLEVEDMGEKDYYNYKRNVTYWMPLPNFPDYSCPKGCKCKGVICLNEMD